jgi:NinB protein
VRRAFTLINKIVRDNAVMAIRCAPIGYRVLIEEPKRTLEQNDAFHPIIREIAKAVPLCGKKRTEKQARTIFMSAFRTWQGQQIEMVEGLEGEPVAIGLSTADLKKSEASDFIEYLNAFAAEHNVTFHDQTEAA